MDRYEGKRKNRLGKILQYFFKRDHFDDYFHLFEK